MTPYERVQERMAGVDQSDPDACHEWPWAKQPGGYGHMQLSRRGPFVRITRVVLAHKLGRDLTRQEEARHTCDNPPCVNPNHLIPGTHRENMQDMVRRGNSTAGERQPNSKLTEAQILAIASDTRVHRVIAAEYGISGSLVSMIQTGKRWGHLTRDVRPVNRTPGLKLTDAEVSAIRKEEGPVKDIAKKYNVSTSLIYLIRKGEYRQATADGDRAGDLEVAGAAVLGLV